MWPGSDLLITTAGGEENGMIEGTRRSGAWERRRRKVDFALLVSRVGLGQLGSRHVVGNDRFRGHSVCTLYIVTFTKTHTLLD